MKASKDPRRLTLVSSEPLPTREPERGILGARPADRCEPWTPKDVSLLADLHAAAGSARINSNLAAVLIVERSLLELELENLSPSQATSRLDAQAQEALVEMELTTASADYLRALTSSSTATSTSPAVVLKLPMRLSDRILRFGLDQVIHPHLLESAISWERASVLSGQTMSEWALGRAGAA